MKVIITGSTGMIGKGVLLECIDDPRVEKVLLINRNPIDITHSKVEEKIHKDFTDFSAIEHQLTGYDTCFHCMGVSAAGMSEEKYTVLTYDVTKALADIILKINPNINFNYVSGTGTDSTEKSRMMWARVKGRTENMLLNMGFKYAYMWRPGAIFPERGLKSRTRWYNAFYVISRPLRPFFLKMKSVTTTSKMGKAMINIYFKPQDLKYLDGADINELAAK